MSEVYKATENKIKINTTSDSDVYKATKNAQITDTEAYKKTLGNKIQQDVASKINHRFTPDFSKTNVAKTIVETKKPELKTTIPSRTYDESYVKELQLKNNMNAAKREYEETKANDDRNILVKFLQMGSDLSPVYYTKTRYDKAKKDYEDFKSAKYYSSLPNGTVKSTNPDKDFFKANDSVDMKYEYINDINNARNFVKTTSSATGSKNAYKIYDNMTDREIGIYNYLYETEGKNKAEEFLKFLETDLDALLNQDVAKFNKQFAEKFPILSSAASVAGTFASVGEQLKNYGEYLATGNMKTNKMSTATSTIRDTVSKKVDLEIGNWDAFDFVYNTVMSGADSFVAASSGPLGAVALGLSAAGSTTNDILARGGDSSQAFWGGAAAGVFEGFFEKFSIGQLNAMQEGTVKGFKDYALNLVKSMGVNFSEEAATEVANILYDYAMNGGISNYSIMVQEFVDNGDSLEVAKKKAAEQLGLQVLEAGASGALMGFGFASINSAASYKNASSIGKMIAANESESEVLNAALSMNGNTESYKMASEIKNSGEITTAKMGGLVSQIMSDISNQKSVAIETAVSERAKELGIDSKTARNLTSYLTKAATNGKIESIEADDVGKNTQAQQIINEIKNNESWAENLNSQLSLLEKTEQTVRNAITLNTPESAVQSTPTTESEVESGVAPVEQSGEFSETPVVSQQERETVFTEPTNQEIYRDPTAEENAEAMFGRRKSAKQRHIIDVAKKLDNNMKVVFVDKNSKSLNGKNGKYNRDTNTMYIAKDLETNDIKLVESYVEVFKHEFVHRLELRKAYKSFKDYLFNKSVAFEKYAKARLYYIDRVDADLTREDAINALVDMYVENSKGDLSLTREQAEREAVADFVARTLFKEKSADFLMAVEDKNIYDKENGTGFAQMETDLEFFEEMASTDRTLLQKIIDAIKDLIASIKGYTKLEQDLKYLEERLTRVYESADNKKAATESGEVYKNISNGLSNENFQEDKYYARQIDKWEELDDTSYITVGNLKQSSPLNLVGMPEGKMYFDVSKIKKEMTKHDDHLDTKILKNIPMLLSNPIVITEYAQDNTVNVYGMLYYHNTPVVVGVVATKGRGGNVITKIRTVHARGNFVSQITDDTVLYLNENKKETDKWFQAQGQPVPMRGTKYGFIRSITLKGKDVNSSFSSDNLDTDYLKAVESKDMETAQKMVDEAANKSGYTVKGYHGTGEDFNIFSEEKISGRNVWGKAFYFGTSKGIADDYASYRASKGGNYRIVNAALKMDNPFIPHKSQLGTAEEILDTWFSDMWKNSRQLGIGYIQGKLDNSPLDLLQFMAEHNNVEVKDILQEYGFDSVKDGGELVVFNSNQIKSADPVTYDDDGNVIPLSERFNDENVDIRYSSDDLSALQRDLYDRHKNGELTNEEYTEETDKLWGKANETYGAFETGENAKAQIATPTAVAEDKPTERFTRTIIETSKLTEEMLQGMEEKVLLGDFSYKVISDEKALQKADSAIKNGTAEDIWESAVNDGKRINKNEIAVGEQLLKDAIESGNTKRVLELSAELADIFTRAGQVVQAARLLKKMTGAGRLVSAQRTIKTINNDLRAKYGEDFPPVKISPESAKRLAEAKTAGGIEYAYQEIMQEVAAQVPVTFMDKWNAWRHFAMLSNPKTHIRNLIGNGIFVPAVVIKDALAVGMETAFVKDSSKKTKSLIVKKEYYGFAIKDAKDKGIKNLLKGNKYNDKTAIRENQRIFKTEVLEFLTNFNSNALEAEDMLFKNIHYIHALAGFLQARKVDLNNVSQDVLDEARIYAVKEAKKATFNDESALANAIQRFGNKNLGTSILVEGVLPFKRTPINIVKRGIEYSPIGLAKTLTKGLYDVKKGKITVSEYIDGLASGLTGTGIMLVGMFLASLGCITGGEDDDKESEFEKWLGKQEYAVEVFGKSYTVDWAAPSNIPFFIGVEIVNTAKEGEDFSLSQLGNAVWNSLEPITNLSMLSGMQSVIESARYADSAQTLSAIAVDAITSYGMQAVPSLSGALARTIDPTQRSWYIDKNDKVLDSTAQTIKNNIQSKVPGLSYTQIPKIDIWGREVSRGGAAERVLENFVSPGYYSEIEVTKTSEELKRIFNETDQDVFPNIAAKSFKVGDETKHLTAREYVTYAKAKGSYSYEYIKEFMEATAYKKLTDKEKADVITKLYEYANAKAKAIVSDYDLMKNYKTVTQWEQNGRSAIDYYIFRAINK